MVFVTGIAAAEVGPSSADSLNRRASASEILPVQGSKRKTLSGDGTGLLSRRRLGEYRARDAASIQNYRLHDHKATAPPRGICSLGGAALNTGP
jgi:hypothetical protein